MPEIERNLLRRRCPPIQDCRAIIVRSGESVQKFRACGHGFSIRFRVGFDLNFGHIFALH